jgi:aromatic ring-cleaving dioxygenase
LDELTNPPVIARSVSDEAISVTVRADLSAASGRRYRWMAGSQEELVMTGLPELHGYHVHIYYNEATMPIAAQVRDALAANFPVQVGKNQGIAGPHPVPQMQVIFKTDAFPDVVQWLMFNRQGLDILVHPLSNDEYEDHTSQALWLGTPVKLKIETLPHGPYPAYLLPGG